MTELAILEIKPVIPANVPPPGREDPVLAGAELSKTEVLNALTNNSRTLLNLRDLRETDGEGEWEGCRWEEPVSGERRVTGES